MTHISLFLLALSVSLGLVDAQCSRIKTRYECRQLPDEGRKAYIAAFDKIYKSGVYDKYINDHVAVSATAHGVPEFFPWHREYLYRIEKDLGVDLCYWDWAYDAQAPEVSVINSEVWFGLNGKGGCITGGYFADGRKYDGECIKSNWDGQNGGIGALYSMEYVAKLITESPNFETFSTAYEAVPHARVHNAIGETFSKMMSPSNPLFFGHHTNVDRHWAMWQKSHPDKATDFTKALTTQVPVYNTAVSQLMDISASPYCYTYANMDTKFNSKAGLNRRSLSPPPLINRLKKRDCEKKCGEEGAPPCDSDRKDLVNLRTVKQIPDWWLKSNNINITLAREVERQHDDFIQKLNDVPGYVPASALYNRPKLLQALVKQGESGFYVVDEHKKKVELPCVKKLIEEPEKAVETLRKAVEETYKVLDYDKVKDSLKQVVGGDVADYLTDIGKKYANKPFEPIKKLIDYVTRDDDDDDDEEYCDVDEED